VDDPAGRLGVHPRDQWAGAMTCCAHAPHCDYCNEPGAWPEDEYGERECPACLERRETAASERAFERQFTRYWEGM